MPVLQSAVNEYVLNYKACSPKVQYDTFFTKGEVIINTGNSGGVRGNRVKKIFIFVKHDKWRIV